MPEERRVDALEADDARRALDAQAVPLPTDPDVTGADRPRAASREGLVRGRADILAVIAVGGAIGSCARYGLAQLMPHTADEIAWSTVVANLTGAFLLGLLMVFVNDVWLPNRYVRPFLGVGVLGGYTTFSTYMLDAHALGQSGHRLALAAYVLVTLVGGLLAVWLGVGLGRLRTRPRRKDAR